MDAQVVDIGETEREFQADMPPLEPLDMNIVTRAKTILVRTAKELAKGNRRRAAPRLSAPADLFLTCASPSHLSVGPRRLEGIGVEEITESAKKYTRAKKGAGICPGTRTKSVPHTMQRTPRKRHSDPQT